MNERISQKTPFGACLFFTILFILLGGNLFARLSWREGDPIWQFWFGDMLGGFALLFFGASIIVAVTRAPHFIKALRSRSEDQYEVTKAEQLRWYSTALLMILAGLVSLIIIINAWIANCNPPGC